MSTLNILLVCLALFVAALFGGVWVFQNYGIYEFPKGEVAVVPEGARAIEFRSADGQMINAWFEPSKDDRPVVMSLYGNGSGIDGAWERVRPLRDLGYGMVMMEYRGGGTTGGKSSEANFAADALALYDQLDSLTGTTIAPTQRVLHGFSLGAGVGSRLASQRPFAAVVLEASPYRTCLYYQDRFKGFPFCSVMWAERYDIIDYVQKIAAPKLIVHGALDEALPVERARRLFAEAPEPKEYVEIPGGHHADLDRFDLAGTIDSFVSRTVAP